MRCCVCDKEIPPQRFYCDSCRDLLGTRKDRMKRRAALREAYDPSADGFRCHHSGALLEERDLYDPFHLCYDHYVPVETSRLVVSSELFNQLKYVLTPEEFHRVVEELAAHFDGRLLERDLVDSIRPPAATHHQTPGHSSRSCSPRSSLRRSRNPRAS